MLSIAGREPDRKQRKSKNVVRAAIRAATNPPPRAARYLLSLIGDLSDWGTGRNAHAGTAKLARLDGTNERNFRRKLRQLYDGHWLDTQDAPDPGPDRERFLAAFKDRPDRRPSVWRIVLETLSAQPGELVHDGAFPACSRCNPERLRGQERAAGTATSGTATSAGRERVVPIGSRYRWSETELLTSRTPRPP